MNFSRLYHSYDHYFPSISFLLVSINCASATIGLLYLQKEFDVGFQYLPGVAAALYFIHRALFSNHFKSSFTANEMWVAAFVFSTGLSITMHAILGMDVIDQNNVSSFDYTIAMWGIGLFYLFAGAASKLLLDYYKLKVALNNFNFSHLLIAEWVVFLLVGSYAFAGRYFRTLIIIVAVVALFSLQGRSSTLFTATSFMLFGLLTERSRFLVTLALGATILGLLYYFVPIETLVEDTNQFQLDRMLLTEDTLDDSLEDRTSILWFSISHLPTMAWFGDPTFLAEKAFTMGSYIHNLLSVWQFFGLIPLIIMVVMIFKSLRIMLRTILSGSPSVMDEAAAILLIYATISVIFSKSIVFHWIWFSVGYWMLLYPAAAKVKSKAPSFRRRKRRFRF